MAGGGDTRFSVEIEGLAPLHVVRVDGVEELSGAYRFELVLASEDHGLAIADVLGKGALVTLRGGEAARLVHGIVACFEQGEEDRRFAIYHATVVPRTWLLEQRFDCRIFQEMSVRDIIARVLDGAGVSDYRFVLHEARPKVEYCVQYRESDWAFISRLMEREGITSFFEHREGAHVLVMADTRHAHEPIVEGPLLFRPSSAGSATRSHVTRFRVAQKIRPGRVTLRDYNFQLPNLSLESQSQADADGALEVYDYPGGYARPDAGDGVARVRLEQRRAPARTSAGASTAAGLCPGYVFTLEEHPQEPLNGAWLVTRVEHHGVEPLIHDDAGGETRYENTFACVPAGADVRPPERTPRPTIHGVQTAIVVGPAGEEIYTDQHGRVKVQFHWDRQGARDERSSCWIRVSQIFAGQGWGAMWIPRVGHEVIVDFLEGDPDRPIITGRVYHEINKPPYPLPAERTKSSIKSVSSPGSDGFNELRFEDKKGAEEVFLHAQRDLAMVTEHDKAQLVGHDEGLRVGNDRSKEVGNDESVRIGRDHGEIVGRDQTIMVGNDRSEAIGASATETVGLDKTVEVGRNFFQSAVQNMSSGVGGSKSIAVAGAFTITAGSMTTTVDGDHTETAGGTHSISAGSKFIATCGGGTITIDSGGVVTIVATDMKIQASGEVAIEAGSGVKVTTGGPVVVRGSAVKLN